MNATQARSPRASSHLNFKYCRVRSVEDTVGRVTGDKIASAIGADVKLRAERKLGGRAEALTPQLLGSVFIFFGGPLRAMEHATEREAGHKIAALAIPGTRWNRSTETVKML